jgi:hypothetical protein
MEVLSLVAELKGQGRTYADIHATLKTGQRGTSPELLELSTNLKNNYQGLGA